MSDSKFTRRQLLVSMALGGGAAAFGGLGPLLRFARATGALDAPPDRFYIFCYFSGGWDTLLSLDPRDPALFREDNVAETLTLPGYDQLVAPPNGGELVEAGDFVFGPYIGALAEHSDKLAVVRGMSMDTLTHQAGMRRFLTGKPPSGLLARGSSASTWLAGLFGSEQLIPNLSVRVENYNVDFPPYATALRVSTVPDLVRALRPGDLAVSGAQQQQIDRLLDDQSLCPKAQASAFWQQAEGARVKAKEMIANDLDELFDFGGNAPEVVAMRDRYGISANRLDGAEVRAASAVTAITSGVSRCVSVQIAGGLDTHFDNWTRDQGPNQQSGFDLVATMLEDLESRSYPDGSGRSWLDVTTLVGFSEFSRTALINGNGGRDHNITNACFLAGGGIGGDRVIGASSEIGMGPSRTNLTSGLLDPAGEIIKPEHVIRTLMVEAGIDDDLADLRVPHVPALLNT
jgi:uncharacterized protein (DUF1501 family)